MARRGGGGGGISNSAALRCFVAFAALGTLYLVGYAYSLPGPTEGLVDDDHGGPSASAPKASMLRGKAGNSTAGGPRVPSFYVPIELRAVEHGDPRVTLCKLDFDSYWRDPSKTPMFRDLTTMSKCGKGDRSGSLDDLVADLPKRGITPLVPTAFVFHESRVGSTLVANMLASVPTNLVYSESPPPPIVLNHCRGCTKERQLDLLRKLVSLMGASPFHTHLYFKFQSITVPAMTVLAEAFPTTPFIFVYREPVQVMMSHFKNGNGRSAPCVREHVRPRKETAAILGMSQKDAQGSSSESYCAAHLSMLCEAALEADAKWGNRALMVDYNSLPGALVAHVVPKHFHVDVSLEDQRRMVATSKVYSKARVVAKRAGEWAGDSAQKEKAASAAVKAAAAELMEPRYNKLVAATKAKTGGDDLYHYKDFTV